MGSFIDRCADFDGNDDQQSADCALLMALYNEGVRAVNEEWGNCASFDGSLHWYDEVESFVEGT